MKRSVVSKTSLPKWRITRIAGRRAEQLGDVRGPKTAQEAVQRYLDQNEVDAQDRGRLAAYRVDV